MLFPDFQVFWPLISIAFQILFCNYADTILYHAAADRNLLFTDHSSVIGLLAVSAKHGQSGDLIVNNRNTHVEQNSCYQNLGVNPDDQ